MIRWWYIFLPVDVVVVVVVWYDGANEAVTILIGRIDARFR